jgi:hypothetical protein
MELKPRIEIQLPQPLPQNNTEPRLIWLDEGAGRFGAAILEAPRQAEVAATPWRRSNR